jgi:DNA-binding MarR family transcriptional regulator
MNEETLTLLRALMKTSKVLEAVLDEQLADSQLSTTRLLTLKQINETDEPLSLGQLASCLAFVKSNATQLIDRLEAETLVRRVPAPHDRRCTLLELTDDGKQRYQDGLKTLEPLLDQLETLYSADERAQLLALMQRLTDSLK